MLEKTRDYLKCCIENKFTLTGYLSISSSVLSGFFVGDPPYLIAVGEFGTLALLLSRYGLDTYVAYRRTREHIDKFNKLDDEFKNKMSPWYCSRVGIRLAAREAGLEELL